MSVVDSRGVVRPGIQVGELVYGTLMVAFLVATVLAGRPIIGAVVWYAQVVITAFGVVSGIVIRERLRGARRSEPARIAYPVAWSIARSTILANDRLISYGFIALFLPLYLGAFTGWKAWVTESAPFAWDATFARWDRWLTFGVEPWRLLHPIFGTAFGARALSRVYAYLWTIVLHGVVAWVALTRRPRFMVASMIAWPLCGLVLAGLFLSAGPAFYAHVAPSPDPYAELVAFHRAVGSSAAFWQSYLWDVHTSGVLALGAGISAMPSMHLAAATLCACAVWGRGRRWRIAAVVFVALMEIGSIYTGWHYAVDGYVGIISALVIWWLSGRGVMRSYE